MAFGMYTARLPSHLFCPRPLPANMSLHTLTYATDEDGCGMMKFPTRVAETSEDYVIDILLNGDAKDQLFYTFLEAVVFNTSSANIEAMKATGYNADTKAVEFLDSVSNKPHSVSIAKLMKRIERASQCDDLGGVTAWSLDTDPMQVCVSRWNSSSAPVPAPAPASASASAVSPSPPKKMKLSETSAAGADSVIDLTSGDE